MTNRQWFVIGVIALVVLSFGAAYLSLGLGDGRCSGASRHVDFEFTDRSSGDEQHVTIVHWGGDSIGTNNTFVATGTRIVTWESIQPPQGDGIVSAGDNVTMRASDSARIEILYQRPPPETYPFDPTRERCYATRNQTLDTYTPSDNH
jgi:hypothetical protein